MRSKNNAPTAAQKRWREAVRELGSVISGGPAVIHHPIGTGKGASHKKIHIGHAWVIPMTDEEHKALHRGESPWLSSAWFEECETRKEFEKLAFHSVVGSANGFDNGITGEIYNAVMGYHR